VITYEPRIIVFPDRCSLCQSDSFSRINDYNKAIMPDFAHGNSVCYSDRQPHSRVFPQLGRLSSILIKPGSNQDEMIYRESIGTAFFSTPLSALASSGVLDASGFFFPEPSWFFRKRRAIIEAENSSVPFLPTLSHIQPHTPRFEVSNAREIPVSCRLLYL
jgi:hypothetical protein